MDRRQFVIGSLAAAGALGLRAHAEATPKPVAGKKSILILGGTNFLGPHVVEAAKAREHAITLFNRGKTHPGMFPDVEKLHGDRDGHLEALAGRKWDAVVDPSGYLPRLVKASAELLAPNVKQYIFISTISVYAKEDRVDADESLPVETLADPKSEDVKANYGALKALCEKAAEAAMPGRVANIRPGLIVGPGDPTGRFSHWPSRMAAGGEVLCPGDGSTPTQWIDGRDLGAWIVKVIEQGTVGTMNALGPAKRTTMKAALDEVNHAVSDKSGERPARSNAGGGAESSDKGKLVWVDADFLAKHDVSGWSEMPMWLDNKGDLLGFGTLSNKKAVAAGLTFRPIGETARDTLAWLKTVPEAERAKLSSTGITRDKEAKVIAAWKARATTTGKR